MDIDTAKQALGFLREVSENTVTVTLFGGEPLLEFDLIKRLVHYSESVHGQAVSFRLSTNGILLRDKHLEFFKDHGIYFVLSIDGCKAQHDANRCFPNGTGSYESVAGNIRPILHFNPYTIAVSVVTPDTARFVADGVIHLFDSGFRYVLQTLDYSAHWKSSDLKMLKGQYKSLSSFYRDSLGGGRKIYYSVFDERIKTWAQKPYGNGDLCDLANSQIAISPSGNVYPCVQFINGDTSADRVNAIGTVFDGFDCSRRFHYVEENYREKESCRGCALHGRCSTYCGCVNWRATGSLCTVPPIICEHERMLLPIVDRMANDLWKSGVDLFKRKFYDRSYPVSSYIEDCCKCVIEGENAAS